MRWNYQLMIFILQAWGLPRQVSGGVQGLGHVPLPQENIVTVKHMGTNNAAVRTCCNINGQTSSPRT